MVWKKGKESLRDAVERLDKRLWHQLEEVWRLAEEGIQDAQRSKDGHQQGTPHCRAVEESLAALVPDDWKGTRFSATDLFVLSAAAALHDTGKAGDSPDDHGHVYTVIVSPGYFAQQGQWPLVAMFAVLLILALVSLRLLARSEKQ